MHIATLGDIMLDVIVDAPDGLRTDDDTESRIGLSAGGQAANVATWAVALGAQSTLIGPRGRTTAGDFIDVQLATAGVDVVGINVPATGTVVSILASGTRTLASDAGDQTWVDRVDVTRLPTSIDWLHLSAYPLLRAADPGALLACVEAVRRRGVRVSVDLSSAGLITAYGPGRFAEVLVRLAPHLVFANASEWETLATGMSDPGFDLVIKRGVDGAETVIDGRSTRHQARPTDVVDLTGAGDALAAGYLVGGIELALDTAARCISQRGAQPPST